MDRTAWIAVSLCLLGIVLLTFNQSRPRPADAADGEPPPLVSPGVESPPEPAPEEPPEPAEEEPPAVEGETVVVSTEDGAVDYTFTTAGGGIEVATLNNHAGYPEGRIRINERANQPIGSLLRGNSLPARPIVYTLSRPDDHTVRFSGINESKVEIHKTYRVPSGESDPYWTTMEVELKNTSDVPHRASDYYLYTGALSYLHRQEMVQNLLFNWHDEKARSIQATWFDGSRFLLVLKRRGPTTVMEESLPGLRWAGPCNQFFASLVVPEEPGPGRVWARRMPVELQEPDGTASEGQYYALHGGMSLPEVDLAPGDSVALQYHIYTGPRERLRLKKLGNELEDAMHYDNMPIFGGMLGIIPLVAKSLNWLMVTLKQVLPWHSWGLAIILITCLIRTLLWPLHARSQSTMKRMSLLAPKMTELREQYPDNPQKLQQETMKLYRDFGVNPVGGCLPIFLQLPIFLGFYQMLRSAVELRNQKFIWVDDLSMPDTLFTIHNFPFLGELPFNLMPLLMAGTMVLQMQLAPKTGDKMQRRIFMLMPLLFLVICYNFASALALYWTGQNIFSIAQTWLMNRRPEPELVKKEPRKRLDPRQLAGPGQKPRKPKKRQRKTGG